MKAAKDFADQLPEGFTPLSEEAYQELLFPGGSMEAVLPVYESEAGSFRGDFKGALKELRALLGVEDLGFVYDQPCVMVNKMGARTTIIQCVRSLAESPAIMTHASVPAEDRAKLGIDDTLVRLSVGCAAGSTPPLGLDSVAAAASIFMRAA